MLLGGKKDSSLALVGAEREGAGDPCGVIRVRFVWCFREAGDFSFFKLKKLKLGSCVSSNPGSLKGKTKPGLAPRSEIKNVPSVIVFEAVQVFVERQLDVMAFGVV